MSVCIEIPEATSPRPAETKTQLASRPTTGISWATASGRGRENREGNPDARAATRAQTAPASKCPGSGRALIQLEMAYIAFSPRHLAKAEKCDCRLRARSGATRSGLPGSQEARPRKATTDASEPRVTPGATRRSGPLRGADPLEERLLDIGP